MNNLFCKPRRAFARQEHEEQDETRIVFARQGRRGSLAPVLGGTALLVLLFLFLLFGIGVGIFVVPLFLLLYVLLPKSKPKRMRRGYFDHR